MNGPLNELAQTIHENSKAKGWYDTPRKPAEIHMLIVTEIAEATESVRNNEPALFVDVDGMQIGKKERVLLSDDLFLEALGTGAKPEGEAVEMADALIRILDWAAANDWDMDAIVALKMRYNATRGHRHGGKAL